MSQTPPQPQAWLVRLDGLHKGLRYRLDDDVVRLGREPRSEISVRGTNAGAVSARHAEIRRDNGALLLADLGSTNGTLLNGRRIEQAELMHGALIELGEGGPRFLFELDPPPEGFLSATMQAPRRAVRLTPDAPAPPADGRPIGRGTAEIVRRAVIGARQGAHRSRRGALWAVSLALAAMTAYGAVTTWQLRREKSDLDRQIAAIEANLVAGDDDAREVRRLLDRLEQYQQIALRLEESILYRLTEPDRDQLYVERELRVLLMEFGAERPVAPPELAERVLHHIRLYQGADRQTMRQALDRARGRFDQMRTRFEAANLPPDLAYVALAESALVAGRQSLRGAAGLWQLTPETARALGLRVDAEVDERHDPTRSTDAAARYLRSLILEFGSGSSVLLALAAYNSGPTKVRAAVRRVENPIAQRNFWYLYAGKTLPAETREYVPRILAAIVIGRNPERFGF